MKTIRAPHTRVPELDLLLFKCGRRFGEADGCAVAESLGRSVHSLKVFGRFLDARDLKWARVMSVCH